MVVADDDEPAEAHALRVAESVGKFAKKIAIVKAAEGKDAADHLRTGRALKDFTPWTPTPNDKGADEASARAIELTPASEIQARRVRWLWQDWIPLRGLVVVAGEPGIGKSTFTNAFMVAKLTRGDLKGELHGSPVDVLVATAEDDWEMVIKPRLEAAGADLERVHRVEVRDPADGVSLLTLPGDVRLLEDAIQHLRELGRTVGMVVIDPIGAFLAAGPTRTRTPTSAGRLLPLGTSRSGWISWRSRLRI